MNNLIKVNILIAVKEEEGFVDFEPKEAKIPLEDVHSYYAYTVNEWENVVQVNFYSTTSVFVIMTFAEFDRLKTAYDKSQNIFKVQQKFN